MMKKIILSGIFFLGVMQLSAQHTLILKSGEKMNGTLQQVVDNKVSFKFKGNVMSFPLNEVSSITFSDASHEMKLQDSEIKNAEVRGVKYEMAGRTLTKQPKIENLTMEKGIVVVEISIDKYGHVTKATPGAEGTTTTSNYLLTKAKQAAESVLFDNCPKCPLESKGTITIPF
ncbi:MAG TPA: hypothetical protein PKN14_01680 [Bacteroidia bacterium]|nr:hypothetical protein [Bacteroidia bacterium]MBX3105257.1 hypothetical protein [Bacteroidota bacterium]MCB0850025.1 hypothetical protein [Bacteroidota bacterium]MCB8930130.1 hypothetical protein [Bacteroidia bacterium]MCW5931028.1 hypothetical protein [Bacteroidota bacterium]